MRNKQPIRHDPNLVRLVWMRAGRPRRRGTKNEIIASLDRLAEAAIEVRAELDAYIRRITDLAADYERTPLRDRWSDPVPSNPGGPDHA